MGKMATEPDVHITYSSIIYSAEHNFIVLGARTVLTQAQEANITGTISLIFFFFLSSTFLQNELKIHNQPPDPKIKKKKI